MKMMTHFLASIDTMIKKFNTVLPCQFCTKHDNKKKVMKERQKKKERKNQLFTMLNNIMNEYYY